MATSCTSSQPGCTQIYCEPAFPDPGSLYIAMNPTGSGGMALNCNFQTIQYRQPKCYYESVLDALPGDDSAQYFCVGSRLLNIGPGPFGVPAVDKMWICVDNTEEEAIWVPWLRWQYPEAWQPDPNPPVGESPIQFQVLMVDTHFGVDGEVRRIDPTSPGSPLILVPQGTAQPNGAVILGIDGELPGGNPRGASAIDFQNSRNVDTQVASGNVSFIAGGGYNTAAGIASYAEGIQSMSLGQAAHAEGYADVSSLKQATAQGAHVEGNAMTSGAIQAIQVGAHAEGNAAGGAISASGPGAHAEGNVTAGTLAASSDGAHVQGTAVLGGAIQSIESGTHAGGSANGSNSSIQATAVGAFAHGSATTGGSINAGTVPAGFAPAVANPADAGAVAFGNAAGGGIIAAGGDGAFAHGDAKAANALIIAIGDGPNAQGKADQNSTILAQADGAQASGVAEANADPNFSGLLQATGSAAHAQGSANSATLTASGEGSHAEGSAENHGAITASNTGSHAEGSASDSAFVLSSNEGSHAEGHASGNVAGLNSSITASGEGAHAEGNAEVPTGGATIGTIAAISNGAHAEGSASGGTITAGTTTPMVGGHVKGHVKGTGPNGIKLRRNLLLEQGVPQHMTRTPHDRELLWAPLANAWFHTPAPHRIDD